MKTKHTWDQQSTLLYYTFMRDNNSGLGTSASCLVKINGSFLNFDNLNQHFCKVLLLKYISYFIISFIFLLFFLVWCKPNRDEWAKFSFIHIMHVICAICVNHFFFSVP